MNNAAKELPSSDIGKYIQLFGLLLVLGVVGSSYMKKEGGEAHSADQSSEDSTSTPGGSPTRSGESLGASLAVLEEKNITSLTSFMGQIRPAVGS